MLRTIRGGEVRYGCDKQIPHPRTDIGNPHRGSPRDSVVTVLPPCCGGRQGSAHTCLAGWRLPSETKYRLATSNAAPVAIQRHAALAEHYTRGCVHGGAHPPLRISARSEKSQHRAGRRPLPGRLGERERLRGLLPQPHTGPAVAGEVFNVKNFPRQRSTLWVCSGGLWPGVARACHLSTSRRRLRQAPGQRGGRAVWRTVCQI